MADTLGTQAKSFFSFSHIVALAAIGAFAYAGFFSATGPRVAIFIGVIAGGTSYLLKKG